MQRAYGLLALVALAACESPTQPVDTPDVVEIAAPVAATTTTWPTGTIHKYYSVKWGTGYRTFGTHILPKPQYPLPAVRAIHPNLQQCYQEPGGSQSATPLINFAIRPNLGACGGGGGGGGTMTNTYTLVTVCSSPGASLECALKALGLVVNAGTIAGTCGASWTGVGAVACTSLVVGFGSAAEGYLSTPDCRTCPPPEYPTLRPTPYYGSDWYQH